MEILTNINVLDKITSVSILILIAVAVITDKLVWHTRLKKAEDRAERWERIAMETMASGAAAGLKAAEVTADVIASIPDPANSQRG